MFKYVSIILVFLVSFETTGCLNLGVSGGKNSNQDSGSDLDILNKGKMFVKLAEQKIRKGKPKTQYDHPKYLKSDHVSSAMSSIFFKERGIKGWGKETNVFQESELFELLPHIISALSKASPSQYVLVRSYYAKGKSRFLRTEMYTIFALFVLEGELNLRFSRIQYVPVLETDDNSIFTGNKENVFTDPFSIKKNPSWKLIVRPGQRFMEGYDNWIIIDLGKEAVVKEDQNNKLTTKRLGTEEGVEEKQVSSDAFSTSAKSVTPSHESETKTSIKDQLLELRELEKTGLITSEDYERRKTEILLIGKQEKSIKDKFIELRNLSDEGYIGDTDYEREKRELLDEYGVSGKEIKDVLAEYLELRDEGFITDVDYDYIKKKLLKEF